MNVVRYPNPGLKQECSVVDPQNDDSLESLASQMLDIMYEEEGVGLAASQIGVLKKVVVIDAGRDKPQPMVLLNPRIVKEGDELVESEEGCLSFPDLWILIERPTEVVVETESLDGKTVTLEADGQLARIIQHEIDHINGVTMVDRATPQRRKEALAKQRERANR